MARVEAPRQIFELSADATKLKAMVKDMTSRATFTEFKNQAKADPDAYPYQYTKHLADNGLTAMDIDPQWSGFDSKLKPTEIVGVMSELAKGHFGLSLPILVLNSLTASPINVYGRDDQKQKYLPGTASGELRGSFALTEPNRGSDATRLQLKAEKDGDGWRLYGEKTYITGANGADYLLVAARTGKMEDAEKGITVFLVDIKKEGKLVDGIEIHTIKKVMEPGSPLNLINFKGLRVGEENILGDEGINNGWPKLQGTLSHSRGNYISARALGLAEAALERITEYAGIRPMYNDVLLQDLPMARNMLENLNRQLALAREITYTAAEYEEKGYRYSYVLASLAKLVSANTAKWLVGEAQGLMGGIGFTQEERMSELATPDSAVSKTYEGADAVQLDIVTKKGWPIYIVDRLLTIGESKGFYRPVWQVITPHQFREMVADWENSINHSDTKYGH